MPKFKVGDKVIRIGSLVPSYMSHGEILKVIPNKDGLEWATEYEVRFGVELRAKFYESQLRHASEIEDRAQDSRANAP